MSDEIADGGGDEPASQRPARVHGKPIEFVLADSLTWGGTEAVDRVQTEATLVDAGPLEALAGVRLIAFVHRRDDGGFGVESSTYDRGMGGSNGEVSSQRSVTPSNVLTDAVALVTGGGRGLGLEIARTLVRDGATVCLIGRNPESLRAAAEEINSSAGHAEFVAGDVTDVAGMEQAVDHFRSTMGSISILINNAGIGIAGPVAEADPDEWWRVMEVNVKGPMLMSRLVLPDMLARGHGHIINMGSYQAIAPGPMVSSYATSKAALLRFTDSLSAEVIGSGVIVTAVSPGFVVTDATRELDQYMRTHNPDWEGIDPEYIFEASAVCELIEEIVTGKTAQLHGRLLHVKDDINELVQRADELVEHDLLALRFNFYEA